MSEKENIKKRINIKNKKDAIKKLSQITKKTKQNKKNFSNKKIITHENKKINSKSIKDKKENVILHNTEIDKKNTNKEKTNSKKTTKNKKVENSKNNIKTIVKKENNENIKQNKIKRISNNLGNKLKDKIFEELKDEDLKKSTKDNNKTTKKSKLIIFLFICIVIIGIVIFVKNFNVIEEKLKNYKEFFIGEKVILPDNSIWYVVENSSSNIKTVKLLKETQIDINNDGKINDNDKMKFYNKNEYIFDSNDKASIAYYLNNEYKKSINEKIDGIESVSLLTSKEYVNIREKMGYDYEWTTGNWLASNSLGTWWLDSSQNEKIYVVNTIGSYKLSNAAETNYVRPVITINKESLQ